MKTKSYITSLTRKLPTEEVGNKSQSLIFLQRHHFRIPRTYVLTSKAFDDHMTDGQAMLESLKTEIEGLPDLNYAIRSSTTLEDSEKDSWAGQFETFLNIKGTAQILSSVQKVWESVKREENGYRSTKTAGAVRPKCAVLIQEMVNPVLSGVSFSKNPVTNLNEVVVEAVEGYGEDLVQKGFTPLRWRMHGNSIVEGNKAHPFFPVIKKVVKDSRILERKFGSPVDIEWCFDGKDIYYLQVRSITGLDKFAVYSNLMAREMLPGQIKPLVWSVNIPLVNGTFIRIIEEITGKLSIHPDDLAKSFHYRTYFNIEMLGEIMRKLGLPAETLETMLISDKAGMPKFKPGIRILRHTFRIIRFLYTKLNFELFYIKQYQFLQNEFRSLSSEIETDFSPGNYPHLFNRIFENGGKIAYLNMVIPILMHYYNKKLKKKLQRIGLDYNMLDFRQDFPEFYELSPIFEMEQIRRRIENLSSEIRSQINSPEKLAEYPESSPILHDFNALLSRFGHFSESGNDFSMPKWQEKPELVFQMIMHSASGSSKQGMFFFDEVRYSQLRYPGFRKLYLKAGKFKVFREQTSSLYIFGYGLFRGLFLRLGQELENRNIIGKPEDIFYLSKFEIDQIMEEDDIHLQKEIKTKISARKIEMEETKELQLPTVIYGNEPPVVGGNNLKNLKGVGTSQGKYTGRLNIVKGIADFQSVKPGDIVVIPFSDVSWTPVLVKAGAIVSEAGGMLSHCSIIARELGIPAMVSVDNACVLQNGITATVDGSNGILTIHDNE
jgi:phosphoenolpyruvate synthase/pyruvate phosphate dikinase